MIRPPEEASNRIYRVRIFASWKMPEVYGRAIEWANNYGFDISFCNNRSYINGNIYVAFVTFERPEDQLAFCLMFSELQPQPYVETRI